MRRIITALVAALESFATALAGLGLIALPVFLLTVMSVGIGADAATIGQLVSSIWLLAHGVPFAITLDPQTALGYGLPAEALSFPLSLVPLGITALTLFFAFRAGWRLASRSTGEALFGIFMGTLVFAATGFLLTLFGAGSWAILPVWASAALPTTVYLGATLLGFLFRGLLDGRPWLGRLLLWSGRTFGRHARTVRVGVAETLRLVGGAGLALVALAGVAFTAALFAGFVEISTLSQQLHLNAFGSVIMLLLNLSYLPTFLIWTLAWLAGPGFHLGTGTSVTPFETLLGPIPALPVLGALPSGWGDWGLVAPLLIVLLGLVLSLLFLRPIPHDAPSLHGTGQAPMLRGANSHEVAPVTLDFATATATHAPPSGVDGTDAPVDDAVPAADPSGADMSSGLRSTASLGANEPGVPALGEEDFSDPSRSRVPSPVRSWFMVSLCVCLAAASLLGLIATALATFASGGIGPARLQDLGVSPWLFGGVLALELAVGFLLGIVIRGANWARAKAPVPASKQESDLVDWGDSRAGLGAPNGDLGRQTFSNPTEQLEQQNPKRADSHVRISGVTGPTLTLPGDTQTMTSPMTEFNTAIAGSQISHERNPLAQTPPPTQDPHLHTPSTPMDADSVEHRQHDALHDDFPAPGVSHEPSEVPAAPHKRSKRGRPRSNGWVTRRWTPFAGAGAPKDAREGAAPEEGAAAAITEKPGVEHAPGSGPESRGEPTQERLRRESEQAQHQGAADFVPWWKTPQREEAAPESEGPRGALGHHDVPQKHASENAANYPPETGPGDPEADTRTL